MDGESWYGSAYSGSKKFTQWDVHTANATGFGAAADDYSERGIDLNEQLIRNKPATFFLRVTGDAMVKAGIFSAASSPAAFSPTAHRMPRASRS